MPIKDLLREHVRFIQFCVVGTTGLLVNLAVFTLLNDCVLSPMAVTSGARFVAANLGGFVVSVLTNFLLNDWWTWGDREKRGRQHYVQRLGKFYVVSSAAGAVQVGVAWAFRTFVFLPLVSGEGELGWLEQGAVVIGVGVATLINFVANHIWTFREESPRP